MDNYTLDHYITMLSVTKVGNTSQHLALSFHFHTIYFICPLMLFHASHYTFPFKSRDTNVDMKSSSLFRRTLSVMDSSVDYNRTVGPFPPILMITVTTLLIHDS